jgi:hypothetical protein
MRTARLLKEEFLEAFNVVRKLYQRCIHAYTIVKVGLHFPDLVGFKFPVSGHHSKPTAPTRSRSFIR